MNIYKILEAIEGVKESIASEINQYCQEWLNSEYAPMDDDAGDDKILMQKAAAFLRGQVSPEHINTYAQEMVQAYDGGLYEADYPFAGKAVGQKSGDQVRGTEKAKPTKTGAHPFKGRLVGAMESIAQECDTSMSPLEKKLRARWEETKAGLQEYGMTTGGTAMTGGTANPAANSATDPAAQAKEKAQTQQKVNTLKSAGVPITSVSQAVNTMTKDPAAPTTPQDRQVAGGLGQEVEQLVKKGDPGTVNQLAALIRRTKQGGAE